MSTSAEKLGKERALSDGSRAMRTKTPSPFARAMGEIQETAPVNLLESERRRIEAF